MANHILLQKNKLTSSAASVTFSNIPQTGYTDLKVVLSVRSDRATEVDDQFIIKPNNSSANLSYRFVRGAGASTTTSTVNRTYIPAAGATSFTFGNAEIYIPNYASSNYKSFYCDSAQETNATTAYSSIQSILWSDTTAISSLVLAPVSGTNFVTGSTFSLYGVAATGTSADSGPKASGGNIISSDGTYWYHAFLTSGFFTPIFALTADVLTVAGGGTGGRGGGGAGGLVYSSSQALTQTNYTCTIGAGGGARTSDYGGASPNGNNSQFASLTAAIGGGGGAGYSAAGANGGCGGGAGWGSGTAYSGGTGSQGGNGAGTGGNGPSGGGGGLGGSASYNNRQGANGTTTYSSWLSATSLGQNSGGTYYIGGGGSGGGDNSASTSTLAGGLGGGGTGSYGGYSTPANALAFTSGQIGTGGGGGGGWYEPINGSYAGLGGSGVIIIRYAV